MAENQAETAVEEVPPYTVRVEDAGPATKKICVEVPQDYIAGKITEQFKELRQEAYIPGFRKGKVPADLIQKKFAKDVRDQVKRTIISECYQNAVEKNELQVLGEPELTDADKVELKDGEPLNFSFTVEIQPTITLPELKGIKIKKPKIVVTEEHIDQAMQNLREQQGKLVPVTDRGVVLKDFLTADVQVKVDGNVLSHQNDASLVARPGRVAGITIDDFDKQLDGLKIGETREVSAKVPEKHAAENLRGKELKIEITLKELKRVEPAVIDAAFLSELGFANEQELRGALKEQMDERIQFDIQSVMRRQVVDHLLEQIQVELPAKLSTKQTDRVVQRRALDLMQRGVSQERLEANIEKLREGAADESAKELKSFFVLQKLAEETKVEVNEAELNGRINMIAMQRGERPEKVKQQMSKQGNMLTSLFIQLREEKAIDAVLKDASIEEVEPTEEQQKAVGSSEA
ncbi:MAG: trigger factor [Tepidisphaerales bacterium]